MSILEIDFDNDGEKEVLIGTDGGQLFVFSSNGSEKEVFKETKSNHKKNYYLFESSINSIAVAKESSGKKVIIVGADKIYFLMYLNGLIIPLESTEVYGSPISKFGVFTYKGEQRLVVGYDDGNVYSYKTNGSSIVRIEQFHFVSDKWIVDIAIGDINGDEDSEIFVGTEDKHIMAFRCDGVLMWQKNAEDWIRAVDVADLDGDGSKKIIGSDDRKVYIYQGNGSLISNFVTPHYVLV